MQSTNNPFESSLYKLSNQSELPKELQSYAKVNNKFDKNVLNEINKKMKNLKNTDSDLYSKISGESDDGRINKRVENIYKYFLNKEQFKSFQKKISKTTEMTITKAKKKIANNEKGKELSKHDIICIKISENRLKDIEKDEARKYWEYMNRHYISQDIKDHIIGGTKNSDAKDDKKNSNNYTIFKDDIDYINNSLKNINGYMYGNNSENNFDYEETKSTSDNKFDIEEITNSVKNMPGNYFEKLFEEQDKLNKKCHQKIDELRNSLTRYEWGQRWLKSENQSQTQSQTQSQPLEYLVNLDSISNESNENLLYPVEPPPTLQSEISPSATISDQTSTVSEKQEKESLDKINFLDISTSDISKLQKMSFKNIKEGIIGSYNKELENARNELLEEFRKEQMKAFSKLSELSKKEHSKNSIDKSRQNIKNIKSNPYGFNISTENFLQVLDKITPLANSQEPSLSENNVSEQGQLGSVQQKEKSPSDDSNLTAKNEDIDNKSDDDDQDDKQDIEIDTPENIMDIIIGKMYQSDFLEAVADSLLPLYGYMEDENTETDMNPVSKNKTDTNSKKGKGLFSGLKSIFTKKEDSDNGGFNKNDMQTLLSSLYSTKDSNIYNLRLLYQYEYTKDYVEKNNMNNMNMGDKDLTEDYFNEKVKNRISSDNYKTYNFNDNKINTSHKWFEYTRAILRAYICIKCGITNITDKDGATQSNSKDKTDLIDTMYKQFLNDLKSKKDDASIRNYCTKCLEQCEQKFNDDKDNHYYKMLSTCVRKVKGGQGYFDNDLKEALEKNGINVNKTILKNIYKQDKWLFAGESETELNIQLKEIDKNIKNK